MSTNDDDNDDEDGCDDGGDVVVDDMTTIQQYWGLCPSPLPRWESWIAPTPLSFGHPSLHCSMYLSDARESGERGRRRS